MSRRCLGGPGEIEHPRTSADRMPEAHSARTGMSNFAVDSVSRMWPSKLIRTSLRTAYGSTGRLHRHQQLLRRALLSLRPDLHRDDRYFSTLMALMLLLCVFRSEWLLPAIFMLSGTTTQCWSALVIW
jgi:LPS sulfotransferase NodH